MFRTIFKFSLSCSALILLTACSNQPDIEPLQEKYASTLTKLKDADYKSSYLSEDIGIFQEKTLPAYFGASLIMSQDDYTILKFSGDTLLFNNYGVDNYVYSFLRSGTGLSYDFLDYRAKSYGFKSAKEMYSYLYNFFHTRNSKEILFTLAFLEQKDLLNIEDVFNEKALNNKIDEITLTIFNPYIKFENGNKELKDEWVLNISDKKISFKREDYLLYAQVLLIMDQLLQKQGTVNLYGI